MSKVDRREFLKLVGAGGVGAGAGFMLAESIRHPVEQLIPYPVPPEEYSPGIATWYNSVCGMCPAGCGISVRTREGRAKKIEGNPAHPVNQGRLCALGQAGLQALYNPDRLTTPLQLAGDRGSEQYTKITWSEGLDAVAARLEAARPGGIVILSQGVRGHVAQLFDTFAAALGGARMLHYDFAYPHALYAANRQAFGLSQLPYYDLHNARYLLSFGADYLNNWLSPVHHGLGYGHSRQGGRPRAHCVQVEAKMSLSGAAADEWLPALPGSEGVLALGIAHRIVADGGYRGDDVGAWRAALAPYATAQVAETTGIAAGTIAKIADDFAHAAPGLAIGGGAAGGYSNAVDTLVAVNVLNYLVGNLGRPGGVLANPEPAVAGAARERQASFRDMQALARDARAGNVDVLIVHNTNPVFTLPAAVDFAGALASVPLIVSLSTFPDETTALADIILPSHSYLEAWADDTPEPGVGFPVAAVSQPVVAPLYNTRGSGDILLGLARALGIDEAMPWASTEDFLRARWAEIHARSGEQSDFDGFWRDLLSGGAWGERMQEAPAIGIQAGVLERLTVAPAEFDGDAGERPFVLHPYLSTALHDGRGANLPWMQELPDPLTGIVYGSWVEMNPATARELGLADGDLVTVSSGHGSIEAPLVSFPAIRPDVIAMPVGQGHERYGRYARGRGANPLQLLAPRAEAASGALASHATRVDVQPTGRRAEPIRMGGETRQLGRGIVQTTGSAGGSAGHSARLNSIPIVVEQT